VATVNNDVEPGLKDVKQT